MSENSSGTPEIHKNAVFNTDIQKVWRAVATSEGIDS